MIERLIQYGETTMIIYQIIIWIYISINGDGSIIVSSLYNNNNNKNYINIYKYINNEWT